MKSRRKQIAPLAVAIIIALVVASCATPLRKDAYVGQWRKLPNGYHMTITEAGDHLAIAEHGAPELTGRIKMDGDVRVTYTYGVGGDMTIDRSTGHIIWGNAEYERTAR